MIFTAVKNSISYNSTRVKNNDSTVILLLLILVVVMMVVVVVVAAAFVKSKLCHTNGIHRLCRPVLVECNSEGMTKRSNSMLLECIQLTSAVNKMSAN
jgi:flagellar basal body-associated protein FliL